MRKWLCGGMLLGGFLLFGAAPAQADVIAPAGILPDTGSSTPGLGSLDQLAGLGLAGRPLGFRESGTTDPQTLPAQSMPAGGTPVAPRAFTGIGRPVAGIDADYR